MKALLLVFMTVLLAAPVGGVSAQGLTARERESVQRVKTETARSAQESVEALFARLCPGRCELIGVDVEMESPRPLGEVTPGFEAVTGGNFASDAKSVNVSVLLDSKLPRNFQRNIPRMIQHRLASLAPVIQVRPEVLDFPEPQLEPMPPYLPEPPRSAPEPRPLPAEVPVKAEEPITPPVPPEPIREPSFMDALAPWIGPLVMSLLLFAMMLFMLRKIAQVTATPTSENSADLARRPVVDVEQLRDDLMASRPVRNRVMRQWLDDDIDGVALAVHTLGPELLADLKSEPLLKPRMNAVAEKVLQMPEVTPELLEQLARDVRSRVTSAQVTLDERSTPREWEFLEGLNVSALTRTLDGISARELMHVTSLLRSDTQSALLDSLPERRRRDLFVSNTGAPLSRTESNDLATRLKRAAEEISGASGEATVLTTLLESLSIEEQEATLAELRARRPDVAAEVLRTTLLESAVPYLPHDVVGDAVLRTDLDQLTAFLRGVPPTTRDYVLAATSGARRGALISELQLDVPVGRAQFLEARRLVLSQLLGVLDREGHDITRANLRGLMKKPVNTVDADEVSV